MGVDSTNRTHNSTAGKCMNINNSHHHLCVLIIKSTYLQGKILSS